MEKGMYVFTSVNMMNEREANGKLGECCERRCVWLSLQLCNQGIFSMARVVCVRLCIYVWVCVCVIQTKAIRNLGVRHINFRFHEEILPKLTFRMRRKFICYSLVHLISAKVCRYGLDHKPRLRWTGACIIPNVSHVRCRRRRRRQRWHWLINNWIRI